MKKSHIAATALAAIFMMGAVGMREPNVAAPERICINIPAASAGKLSKSKTYRSSDRVTKALEELAADGYFPVTMTATSQDDILVIAYRE